jgi:phosphoribosylformylglycinamidine cyclo-ligase
MYRTFNMGIGMVAVLGRRDADRAMRILASTGLRSHVIGRVLKGRGDVTII